MTRAHDQQGELLRATYEELCEMHVFLQGFEASETGCLASSFDALVRRMRDNALALRPDRSPPMTSTTGAVEVSRDLIDKAACALALTVLGPQLRAALAPVPVGGGNGSLATLVPGAATANEAGQ